MATAIIQGCSIKYELLGPRGAPCLALTPGGRAEKERLAPLANSLTPDYQILLWDRRNTGASDVHFTRKEFEQVLWADDLAQLIHHLDLGPCYLGGGSAGARVALLTALRSPDSVKALLLWQVSGGPFANQVLGYNYHVPFINAARTGGMNAVAETEFFAERIKANPGNRERLLAIHPEDFIEVMGYWNSFFYGTGQVTGMSDSQLREIHVPTLVFGGNDDIHTKEASNAIGNHIPNVKRIQPVWTSKEFYDAYVGNKKGGVMETLYPRMLPGILGFLNDQQS